MLGLKINELCHDHGPNCESWARACAETCWRANTAMTLAAGTKLGPYEILATIGAGGMGEVYRAKDIRLGRTVAIKILNKGHVQRFEQEARAIAALNCHWGSWPGDPGHPLFSYSNNGWPGSSQDLHPLSLIFCHGA